MHLEVSTPVLVKDTITSYHTYPIKGIDCEG